MAHPEEPQRPLAPHERVALLAAAKAAANAPDAAVRDLPPGRALAFAALAFAACLAVFTGATVPGRWFPSAAPAAAGVRDLALVRGTGSVDGDELVITATDASGTAVISANTNLRSVDYPVVSWAAIDLPETTEVRFVWRSDYAPDRISSVPVTIASGRPLPLALAQDPAWVGRIVGVGLAIRGPLTQPARIRGMVAKPMGALELAGDRAREWLAFEGWSGTSINTVTGGADLQDLPLPLLLVIAGGLGIGLWLLVARRGNRAAALPAAIALVFVAAWFVLDARWTWNLARQLRETGVQYAGKDARARHLAAEDGPLYAFIERASAKLPAPPARVFMFADAHYFRGRGAYHLYPHNVFFEPYRNALPPTSSLRPGDFVVVWQRRGVQYDAAARKLRWDNQEPLTADALLVEAGGALFVVR